MLRQNKRIKILETPALDPVTDESNFEYTREGKRVFTTAYFRDQREMLSAEQFESEFQQQPFEAKGLLFPEKSLNYFFELPVDQDPDTIVAIGDPAEKGEDYTSLPIAAIYDTDVYIIAVVFDDAPPETTKNISNKQTRIEFASDNIIKHFYFKDPSTYARNSQYAVFMKQLTTYVRSGKVKHDDAPDSLALMENELRRRIGTKVEVFQRFV